MAEESARSAEGSHLYAEQAGPQADRRSAPEVLPRHLRERREDRRSLRYLPRSDGQPARSVSIVPGGAGERDYARLHRADDDLHAADVHYRRIRDEPAVSARRGIVRLVVRAARADADRRRRDVYYIQEEGLALSPYATEGEAPFAETSPSCVQARI